MARDKTRAVVEKIEFDEQRALTISKLELSRQSECKTI